MASHQPILSLLLIAVTAAPLAGCGANVSGTNAPAVEFTVDGQYTSKKEFQPDQTGGQLSDLSKVLVRNTGSTLNSSAPPPILDIKSVKFITDNPYLSLKYPKGEPTFPKKLDENEALELHVIWKPDANDENNSPAQLIITHNDENKPDIKIDFVVISFGAKILLDNSTLVYINPSDANPPTQCVTFGNEGNAKLIFKKAVIASAKPWYQVVERPDEGASIDPLGEGDNPKNNVKKLKVCVRLTPSGKDQDYDDALQIESSDLANPKIKVKLSASFSDPAVYHLSCDNPLGAIMYDFTSVGVGSSGVATCNIANDGPGGFVIKSIQVKALNADQQEAVDDMYEVKSYQIDSDGEKKYLDPGTTVSISDGKSRYIEVTLTFPNEGAPADANVMVNFTQANIPDTVVFPISAGSCKTPSLQAAPVSSSVWLRATLDKPAKAKVIIANQSCAPLQIIKICTTQQNAGGTADPCQNANLQSAHFKAFGQAADGAFSNDGLQLVKAWGLYPIEVTLAPPDEQYPIVSHLLNIRYCYGDYQDDKCLDDKGKTIGLTTQTVSLSALVEQKSEQNPIEQPTLKVAAAAGSSPIVGQPFKIEAFAQDGTYPIAQFGAYLWLVASRPAGSKFWLSATLQNSNDNWTTIKPDVAGEYTVVAAVQSYDPNTPSNIAWSDQVAFTFTAK
mgnify:CR=1 FL=1